MGVQDDVVWVDTGEELIGHDVATGRTTAKAPSPMGATCLLADGVHTLVVLDGQYAGHGGWAAPGAPDPTYEVAIHRLVDGTWTPVPDTANVLTDEQIQLTRCIGGGMRAGSQVFASPAWSPASGWVEREPYLRLPDLAVVPEATAVGQDDQLFVLERDG